MKKTRNNRGRKAPVPFLASLSLLSHDRAYAIPRLENSMPKVYHGSIEKTKATGKGDRYMKNMFNTPQGKLVVGITIGVIVLVIAIGVYNSIFA